MTSQLQSLDQEEAKVKLKEFKGLFDSDEEANTKKDKPQRRSRSRSHEKPQRDQFKQSKSYHHSQRDSEKYQKSEKFAHPSENIGSKSIDKLQDERELNKLNQPDQKKSARGFERLKQSKKPLDREEYEYIKAICRKASSLREARDQQERQARRQKRQQEQEREKQLQANRLPQQKPVEQRIQECKKVAEYFQILYETNWNKFDDCFYILNRRWFDRWKDFVSYDYIIKFLIEQGRKESELSINKILSNNSNPGEISNVQLLMDRKDFLQIRNERMHYCNSPLRNGVMLDRDIFQVPEGVWKYLQSRYKGEEIKRYAVYKNQAGIIDRQPYLPMIQMCLVLRDEAIRFPKWLVLPRKSTFSHVKSQLKEVFNWLKEYLDEEIRLWRLHPELKDLEFIEQFNQQLAQKQLPKRMKFPGFSLEKSLEFFIEEYGTFDRFRETLFVEVRKIKTIWLFDLDFKDSKSFDEGAYNFQKHSVIYSIPQDEQMQNNYSIFYKFHNNTMREYWDTNDLKGDPYEQLKKQLNWKPDQLKFGKKSQNKQNVQKVQLPDNVSEISDDDQAQNTQASKRTSTQKSLTQDAETKQSGVKSPRKKEKQDPSNIINQKSEIKLQKDQESEKLAQKKTQPNSEGLGESSTIKILSEEDSDQNDDSSAYDPDEKKQLVIEVKKKSLTTKNKKHRKGSNNSNEESKEIDKTFGKRRKDSIEDRGGELKRFKSEEIPFKFESTRPPVVPFFKIRPIKVKSERDSKIAGIVALLSQCTVLKDQLNYEQGPLSAITKNILQELSEIYDDGKDEEFCLESNKLQNLLDLNQNVDVIYRQYLKKLQEQNQQLSVHFNSKVKQTQICISCGNRQVIETDAQVIDLSNESEDFSLKLSVKLKIIYIYEYDQYKKYEINLKPGEYSFLEVVAKIKERVQNDRLPIKQCKKTFILVDLVHENTVFGQMFSDEKMKFNFKPDQVLTTFAYELSRAQKEKVKKYHFVHIAKADLDEKITYHSFPRLILYNDQDPFKNIALKIFRGLRTTLSSSILQIDPAFMEISENDAYSSLFGQGMANEPYEMVIHLMDGSRWKLDPHSNKKLNSIVNPDNIIKFEAIFPLVTSFDQMKQAFKREVDKQMINVKDQGLKDIEACFRKLISVYIIDGETQKEKCPSCKEQKGAQRVQEVMKLSNILALQLNKMDISQVVEIPEQVNLDRFMSKSSGFYQTGNDYELIGVIGHEKDKINQIYSMIRNSKERQYYQFTFGDQPKVEVLNLENDGRLVDELLTFAIFTKIEKKGQGQFRGR